MNPPKAFQDDSDVNALNTSSAGFSRLGTLTQRSDFQRAARAAHTALPGFVVQMRKRRLEEKVDTHAVRVGFTCSKKVGNAVARNRAKRRLREIARLALPLLGTPGNDYVLIGRKNATATIPFATLQQDFAKALDILHGKHR